MSIEKSITGGTVRVEDGTKAKEEYAPARKVAVELAFAVPEGQDGQKWAQAVAVIADTQVAEMLGRVAPKATPVRTAAKNAAAPAPEPVVEKTKADLAREAGLPAETVTPPKKAPKPADDSLDDLLGDTAPAARVISDKDLGAAASKENGRLKARDGDKHDTAKIRKLVAEFCGKDVKDVPKITDVPADKREDFIKALEAL